MQNWDDFFNPYTCQFVKKQALLSENFWKTSIKFHVPSLHKWQKVLEVFINIGLFITEEMVFISLYQNIADWNTVHSQKIQLSFFLLSSSS